MNAGKYLQEFIINIITGGTLPAVPTALTLHLSTQDPKADGSGLTEPAAPYTPQAVTFSAPVANLNGVTSANDVAVTFQMPAITVTHFAIKDQAGNMIFHGQLTVPRTTASGDNLAFDVGSHTIKVADDLSTYVGTEVVNWVRGTQSTSSGCNLGVSKTDPLRDGSGLSEPPITDGYSRQPVTFSVPTFDVATQSFKTNASAATVLGPSNTNNWGTLTHSALFNTNGDMLIYGELATPVQNLIGEGFALPIGSLPLEIS